MHWNDVLTKITDDDRGKWDRKVPATGIRISEMDGMLLSLNELPEPEPQ